MPTIDFTFFGSSNFSLYILKELERNGFVPKLIVTTPDKPQGRKMIITPTPVKKWAESMAIEVMTPDKLDRGFAEELKRKAANHPIFIVASYGKMIPEEIIEIPRCQTLNVHPSLLPKYRGPSPLQHTILDDTKDTGVTIMSIDKEMDHGAIVANENIHIDQWPAYEVFEKMMAELGGRLLAKTLPLWVDGKIEAKEQDHTLATYTKKVRKENGLINLSDDPHLNFRKIQAYHEWPQAYFLIDHNGKKLRVKITTASFVGDKLILEKVIPEGGKEMSYPDFERGYGYTKTSP